ncbi:hypothetical protein [Thermomonospora cellulosilytica]|uniref:Uncharacterized protein n=1 Tax=Thermomonospora cellulosilytica TaxID=1411118 RepID=A0A7W3RC87_9ACTN|nr:hypothetical protein [Thermomonospora cellulosilytica]MBA9007666.1 hypothetical protein [Thermomonospora cellulosilytica]
MTTTVRPGQSTRPTVTRSGSAAGRVVGGAAGGLLVGVRLGVRDGDGLRPAVRDGDAVPPGPVAVADGVEPPVGDGLSAASELSLMVRSSAGTAINNPMTKNTPAMMNLGNCIALSRPAAPRKARGRWC